MNRKRLTNLSKSGALFSARMAGAGLMFLVQAAIARWWGSDVLADYLLLISAANIAAMVMPLGFQTIGSYFAVEYASHGRAGDLMRFVKRAYLQAGTSAMAFAVAAWVIMQWTGLDGTIASLIVPGLLFAMAMASVFICSALLVGLKHPAAGLLADGLFRPLAVLAGFLLAIWIGEGARLDIMVWVMALAYTAVAAASLGWTLKAVSAVDDTHAPDAAQPRRWWRFALPWVIIATSTEFFFDIDLLMLASLLDKTELAIFGVSARFFALLAFGMTAVYALLLPDMMQAGAKKQGTEFDRCLNEANLAAFMMSLALLAASFVAGTWGLALFGTEFEQGRWALSILCAILVVRAFFGPAELVLSLNDRPWAAMPAVIVGLGGLVVANLMLVPAYGLNGAAFAALIAATTAGLVKWLSVRVITGHDVSLLARFQAAPEGGVISGPTHKASGS
jgi:O-antigen/teichoic acid export membrane protein